MINLKGHSGCKIILLKSNVIRKISASFEYNQRLKKQMEKQHTFNHEFISKPKVLDSGFDSNGMFYFDMEYIRGKNLCKFFENESSKKCVSLIENFLHFKENKKINITKQIIEKVNSMRLSDEYKEIILGTNWDVFSGYCHGDLTFENILIFKNRIYLIDFLDSFVDCPIIDEAKLLQDAFCYWSFKEEKYIPKRKLMYVCDLFDTKQHYSMLLLHLLRILPYSNEQKKEEVLCMISKVKQKINLF